jgi:hypothetical protein
MLPGDDEFLTDQVHGTIHLKENESDLVRTQAFQRLRHLRQTGLINYVFSCAEHSRFVHSLGTLAVVNRMCSALQKCRAFTPTEEKTVRAAALLHDIGHYPLSHLVEEVYAAVEQDKTSAIVSSPPVPYQNPLSRFAQKTLVPKTHHERLSAAVIKKRQEITKILDKMNVDPAQVAGAITGDWAASDPVLCMLMRSGLDCDRLDYLARDSYMAGSTYGRVDTDYLVRSLELGHAQFQNEVVEVLGVNIGAEQALEHYLTARYFHYARVVGNSTSRALECLAKAAILEMIPKYEGWHFKEYDQIEASVDTDLFLRMHDAALWESLEHYCSSGNASDDCVAYLAVLKSRRRVRVLHEKRALEIRSESNKADSAYVLLRSRLKCQAGLTAALAEILHVPESNVGWHELRLDFEKLESVVRADRKMEDETLREAAFIVGPFGKAIPVVLDNSSLMSELSKLEYRSIVVFYIEPEGMSDEELTHLADVGRATVESAMTENFGGPPPRRMV